MDYTRLLLEVADVVYVGQRGIGAAFPSTDCPPPQNTQNTPLDPNFGLAVAEANRQCQALWRAEGVDIDRLTVSAAAADVDELRAALGYEQVVLWGESFDTRWSIAVMRQFPGSVARAVLNFDDAAEALDREYEFGNFWHSASYFQFDCGSGHSPARDQRLLNDPAMLFIGDANAKYRHACPEWPADSGAEFRGTFSTGVPTLIVHGDWDMSTPWENAVELEDKFERGHLVRIRRGGHGALWDAMAHDRSAR